MEQSGLEIFLLMPTFRPVLGPTQPPIQWVPGVLSLGVKWLGCEADHSPPSSAEINNAWSNTSTPQYTFIAWCSVKKSTGTTLPLPRSRVLEKLIVSVFTIINILPQMKART
jgi:hypothetical protein